MPWLCGSARRQAGYSSLFRKAMAAASARVAAPSFANMTVRCFFTLTAGGQTYDIPG